MYFKLKHRLFIYTFIQTFYWHNWQYCHLFCTKNQKAPKLYSDWRWASSFIYYLHLSAFFSFIMSNMLFPPPLPWAVMVLQNRPNVCFPSKGWLNSLTGSISQATLRLPSAIVCSYGGRSLITQACCFSSPLFTSSAEDLTGEAWCQEVPDLGLNANCFSCFWKKPSDANAEESCWMFIWQSKVVRSSVKYQLM